MARGVKLTDSQKQYIINNYRKKSSKEIAEVLGIAPETVNDQQVQLGLRERNSYCNPEPPKPISYPTYIPGQRIKIPTQSGDKSWTRITRGATVLEVYKKKRRVLLAIDGQCPGVQLRYDVSYFDLWTNRAVVI